MAEPDVQGTGSPPDQRRWRGIVQIVLILAVIAVAIYFARAPSREFLEVDPTTASTRIEPPASVVHPTATTASHSLALTGTVTTLGNVSVVPEVSGEIVWVAENFKTGGEFKAGERLAQIDTELFDLAVESAEFGLAVALANLREKLDGEARAEQFRARYPDEELHPWLARDGEVEHAEALVDVARTNLKQAKVYQGDTRISVPFDGFVMATALTEGQVVNALSSELGQVFAKHQLEVRARISTFDLSTLQPVIGRTALARVDGIVYETEVVRVSKVVDLETRMASLFLNLIDQPNLAVLPPPGTFANVTIEGPLRDNVYVLSEGSMQINGTVWLVEDGALTMFEPESLGFSDRGWLVSAFDTKEGVVVGKVPGAREGMRVTAVDINQ